MSILSIQSHVTYGYVGNKAAVYPLQSMGYDVWPINTVQFSNHTGYGKWEGEIFPSEHIRNIVEGLEHIGVANQCKAILSGYMGSQDICHAVSDIVHKFKTKNSNVLYLCDPVIGNTSCFVKPEVLEFFKTNLSADIVTPNQFEAETLSGIAIKSLGDLKKSADYFHQRNSKIVIITGAKLQEQLYVFISHAGKHELIQTKEFPFTIPPNGTGDLFSAVFLGCYLKTNDSFSALKKTLHFMEQVLQNTFEAQARELLVTSVKYSE